MTSTVFAIHNAVDLTSAKMKARLYLPVILAALFFFLSVTAAAQGNPVVPIQKIEAKDTIAFQPLFSEDSPGLKIVRIQENSPMRGPKMEMDRDGNAWKVFAVDGLDVLMNVRYLQHYGKYYRIDLYVQNNTDAPVRFDFRNTTVASRVGPVKLFSQNRYLNRISGRKTAKTIGLGICTLCATLFLAAIVRGDPYDSDSFGEDLLRDIGSAAIEEAGYIATMMMADSEAEDMDRIKRNSIGYLCDYTIAPDNAIEGHAYAKYKPGADSIEITLPIGNRKYVFNWDTTSLVNITEDI